MKHLAFAFAISLSAASLAALPQAAGAQGRSLPTFEVDNDLSKPKTVLRVFLKYGPEGERVIRRIDRASRPGRRLYRHSRDIRPVLDGLGISILSTNKGVLSDRQARAQRLGGELLCTVW